MREATEQGSADDRGGEDRSVRPAEESKIVTTVTASAVLVLVLVVLLAVSLPVAAHGYYHVHADPQVSDDGSVLVERTFTSTDGWVVLHADDGGSLGQPIGHESLRVANASQTDFRLEVDSDVWEDWDGSRHIHVALHRDEGAEVFDPDEDPILSSFGRLAADRFTLRRGTVARVSTKGFTRLKTENATARVRTVDLPVDGHLVAHNVTATGSGKEEFSDPVGSTVLSSGTHEEVPVRLDRSFYRQQEEQFSLGFALYRDDGDGTFTGREEPIRAGGETVATVVSLTRADPVGGISDTSGRQDTPAADSDAGRADQSDDIVVTATATPDPPSTATTADTDAGRTVAADGSGFGVCVAMLAVGMALLIAVRRGSED
jgi:hypothetical protein